MSLRWIERDGKMVLEMGRLRHPITPEHNCNCWEWTDVPTHQEPKCCEYSNCWKCRENAAWDKAKKAMTKEPNKDFRQAVREVIEIVSKEPSYMTIMPEEATYRILALCKEMLVQGVSTSGVDENFNPIPQGEFDAGWNDYNDSLLKQLGEK